MIKRVAFTIIIGVTCAFLGAGINYLIDSSMLKNDPLSYLNRVSQFEISGRGSLTDTEREMLRYQLLSEYNEGDGSSGAIIEQFMQRNISSGAVLSGFIGIIACVVILLKKPKLKIKIISIIALVTIIGVLPIVMKVSTQDIKIDESRLLTTHIREDQNSGEKKYNSIADAYSESKVEDDNWNIIRNMIENGADVNVLNKQGGSMLASAIFWKHYDIAELMINKGANPNVNGNDKLSPLYQSICAQEYDLVELFIEKGADVNIKNSDLYEKTPLHAAVEIEDEYIVELLLENGADATIKDTAGNTPYYYALQKNNEEICKLFTKKSDTNEQISEIMNEDINKNLFIYVNKGDTDKVKQLINAGININAQDSNGDTLLHIYTQGLDAEMVRLLLENGADINIKNKDGVLPIQLIEFLNFDSYKDRQNEIQRIYAQLSNSDDLGTLQYKNQQYDKACSLLKDKRYTEAISTFTELEDYKDSQDKIAKINEYVNAQDLFSRKCYETAAEIFGKLGDFEDSPEMLKESLYKYAYDLYDHNYNADSYDKAINIFTKLGDYKDSRDGIKACKYQLANLAYNSGDYENAYKIFTEIPDYKDSSTYFIKKCLEHINKN